MKFNIPCRVCTEDGICRDDIQRQAQLKSWIEPFSSHHDLEINGLHGIMFTPKLTTGQYGAEFVRRKNGQSVILVSEELWENAQKRLSDLRILQNTLQHEFAHVHNNNRLQALQGGFMLQYARESENLNPLLYRLWDEFYATRLAATSEPSSLLQAKINGVLNESQLLARVMNSNSKDRHKIRKEQLQILFLSCVYLAGSYSGNEQMREPILQSDLRTTPFVGQILTLSELGESLLIKYPFDHYRQMQPFAEAYLDFLEKTDHRYRPFWRRLISPIEVGRLTLID